MASPTANRARRRRFAGVAAGTGIAVIAANVLTWLWGVEGVGCPPLLTMSTARNLGGLCRTHETRVRTNRVFKSLHKPLTYLGVERTLFYFVCVGAVGAFNLFNSLLAGVAVFIGGFAFGHWVTNSDPAFLRILAKSETIQAPL